MRQSGRSLVGVQDIGVARCSGRPIKLLRLSGWAWEEPLLSPFILFIAAKASTNEEERIRRFAANAIEAGCAYVCTWGEGSSYLHDTFDLASMDAKRSVMSSWHDDETLPDALWFALCNAWPDEDEFPSAAEAMVLLAVEEPWNDEVRRLVDDQEELANLALGDDT